MSATRIPDGTQPGDHVLMMQTPDLWPHGFYLPLARPSREGDEPFDDCAVLIAAPGVPRLTLFMRVNIIFHSDIIEAIANGRLTAEQLESIRTKEYADFEAIEDDGWRVD